MIGYEVCGYIHYGILSTGVCLYLEFFVDEFLRSELPVAHSQIMSCV